MFVDDDVEPAPEFLAAHLYHHEKNGAPEGARVAVIGPLLSDPARRAEEPVWIGWEHAMLEKQYAAFESGVWPSAGPNHFYSGNASVRRGALLRVGGFDESFTRQEDVELATRLASVCGVHFVFDAAARGVHRPRRSWKSWLNIPFAYGRLDVVRARRGSAGWELVRSGFAARSRPTRAVARLILSLPVLSVAIRASLRAIAVAAYRLHRDRLAYGVLSVIYNAHYLEGAKAEMGNKRDFFGVLRGEFP